MFTQMIERISRKSPVTTMAHAILNNVLSDEKLNDIFKNHRPSQRENRRLFSMIVGLMTLVVFQVRRSVGDIRRPNGKNPQNKSHAEISPPPKESSKFIKK